MSYPNISSPTFTEDLLEHKEFYELKKDKEEYVSHVDNLINERGLLRLRSHQIFVSRFMNMYGPGHRLYVKHSPGTGKTLLALALAREFLRASKIMSDMGESKIGKVIIIGFNIKPIFYRELLRFPEFGFISRSEIEKYNQLRQSADRGGHAESENLKDFRSMIIRRFYKKKFGGFFNFYGYKEFVNKLFMTNPSTEKEEINLKNLNNTQIRELVRQGRLIINTELVKSFDNSILICDEIHNVYNSLEKNNYGVAIQTILNEVPSLRTLLLSATPLNNLPTEYIDLQNLLLTKDQMIKRADFFTPDGKLKPGVENIISKLMKGRVSFFRDNDPKYFPRVEYVGTPLSINKKNKEILNMPEVPYLKFVNPGMSPLHMNTYKLNYEGVLSIENRTLDDMVFPNPESEKEGMFNTNKIKKKYREIKQAWLDKNKIEISEEGGLFKLSGDFLLEANIGKYSKKMEYAMKQIKAIISNPAKRGKILIYHPYVTMSGVLLIQEMLSRNGIPELGAEVRDNTPCSKCGVDRGVHAEHQKKVKDEDLHDYMPVRFIIAHGNIDHNILTRQRNTFNSPDNAYGEHIMIIIGSKVITEGFDYKGLRHLFVMYHTVNISELIQVIGRGVRHESHSQVQIEHRVVNIYLLIGTPHEEYRYIKKMADHLEIQKIEKIMNAVSIDANIHHDIVMPKSGKDDLVSMVFKPDPKMNTMSLKDLKLSTFYAFYMNDEIRTIKYIIKRLFVEVQTVWNYEKLWQAVQNCTFALEVNPALFLESSYVVALSDLVWDQNNYYAMNTTDSKVGFVDKLFSADKEIMTVGGQNSVIVQMDKLYILFPTNIKGMPLTDVESCYRDFRGKPAKRIALKKYIADSDNLYDYTQNKVRFHARYDGVPISRLTLAICEYNQNFHIRFLEDAIEYAFKIWCMPGEVNISEYHDFNFRMLYFYNSLELVVYAENISDLNNMKEIYSNYILEKKTPKKLPEKELDQTAILAMLESSLEKRGNISGCIDEPRFDEQKIQDLVTESREYYEQNQSGRRKNKSMNQLPSILKVDGSILPIGHILDEVPRMFSPEKGWFNVPDYMQRMNVDAYKENDIIIGYYEKSKTGLEVKFKLRKPIHQIKVFKDTRLIERGSACTSSKKHELLDICKKLGILDQCSGVRDICNIIRVKLIENEIAERRKGTNVKWFYHLIEKQPSQS